MLDPWKKSYNKPRQRIKNQRHYFTSKGPSSQSYGFSSSHVWMCSVFFISQLSHPYMTTGKTIALTRWTFVGKVMSLIFNTLSRCHNFSSKEQESFNFMAAVTICSDFGAPNIKSVTVSIVSPSICKK